MCPKNNYFDETFANAGTRTTVPDAVTGDGTVNYTQGYTAPYSLAPSNPSAIEVGRAQFNQIIFDITSAIQFIQQNGAPAFITTLMNGGTPFSYTLGAIVAFDAGSGMQNWLSTAAANTTIPGAGGASWAPFSASQLTPATITGNSHNFVSADTDTFIQRSNSTTAMTDTLPGTSGALGAGWFAYLMNTDASASDTVGVGSGGSIREGSNGSANSFVVMPGQIWFLLSLGSGNYIAACISKAFSIKTTAITSGGTYTPSVGTVLAQVEMVGAGGGGGGVPTGGAGASAGAAGGYVRALLTAAQIGASQTITIGAAGAGGAAGANNGTAGGTTSVGSLLSCAGGAAGQTASGPGGAGEVPKTAGGTATVTIGTTINAFTGQSGGNGGQSNSNANLGGDGGSTLLGLGGKGSFVCTATSIAGDNATGYGAGGGGAAATNSGGTAAGGNGAPGIVIITEYIAA